MKDNHKIAMKAMSDPDKPSKYIPSTPAQRNQWNEFLHFLYSKGIAGRKVLDQGKDQTSYLIDLYKKQNPSFNISPKMVSSIQYELMQIKNGNIPDGNGNFVSSKDNPFSNIISNSMTGHGLSKVDGRIGSLTSMEGYPVPVFEDKASWGTDYNKYLNDMKSYMSRTGSKLVNKRNTAAMSAMASN